MRTVFQYIAVASLIFLALFGLLHYPAQETAFTPQPLDDIIAGAAALLASLVMIPAFISAVLAILEYLGKVTPAGSDQIQIYANIVLYLLCFGVVLLGKTHLLSALDHYLGGITPLLIALLAFLSGGIHSVIQTRRNLDRVRTLYPFRMRMARLAVQGYTSTSE